MVVLAVGLAATVLNTMVAVQVFLGAFTYGYIYTSWLKRRTWLEHRHRRPGRQLRGAGGIGGR